MMRLIAKQVDGRTSLRTCIERNGLNTISRFYGVHLGDLALPRKFELAAAVNRLRTLRVR